MGEEVFRQLLEEANNDVFLLQEEAYALQTAVDAGADMEAELERLKDQWLTKEHILRSLATRNSIECRGKIKQFRVKLKAYIVQKRRAARKLTQIPSCTSKGLPLQDVLKGVKCRRTAFNRWLSHASPLWCQEAFTVHKQVFKLLDDITVLVKGFQKISSIKQEITALKRALCDTMNFLESNQSLITHWFSKVTTALDIMKLHFPQECSEMKKSDVQSTLNCLHTPNNDSKTQAENLALNIDVRSGKSNQFSVIDNNFKTKEINRANSKTKSLEFANCSKCMCYIYKKNETKHYRCTSPILHDSRKYRPSARKGTQCPYILRDKSVLNCTSQHVTSKQGKENHLYFARSYERDDGNHAESALEGTSNYSMSMDCEVDAIVKEFKIVSPISSLDDSFCESSDIAENVPSYKLDCSVVLEDVGAEVQKAADINSSNQDNTQFISDARGTLTPFAAYEDGPCNMFPKTKEIFGIDGFVKEFNIVSPTCSLNDYFCESSGIISNIRSYELDCSVLLEDVRNDVQKVADINSCNEDSTQFISDVGGTLLPFAAHEEGPCGMFPKTKQTEIFDSKELKCNCHTEGQNLPEEHVNEDYAKGMIICDELQEASAHSTVPLPWPAQFFEGSSAVPVINWE